MIVKNKLAQPGEIKSVVLDTHQAEVRLWSGKVMLYQRRDLSNFGSIDPKFQAARVVK